MTSRAEIEKCIADLEEAGTIGLDLSPGDPLCKRAARLLRELAEDAERYRWLRSHSWVDTSLIKSVLNFGPGYQQTKPEILDAAIDAARKGETT